jgi:glycine cleavage system H protein
VTFAFPFGLSLSKPSSAPRAPFDKLGANDQQISSFFGAPMTTKFTNDHEWINIEDHEAAVVGITLHAQDALGDIVFVDLPAVGASFTKGDVAGVVESVKAAADLYMPVSGEIVAVNEKLRADPALANSDPMGDGWFFTVRVSDMAEFDQLMDAPSYDALLKTL